MGGSRTTSLVQYGGFFISLLVFFSIGTAIDCLGLVLPQRSSGEPRLPLHPPLPKHSLSFSPKNNIKPPCEEMVEKTLQKTCYKEIPVDPALCRIKSPPSSTKFNQQSKKCTMVPTQVLSTCQREVKEVEPYRCDQVQKRCGMVRKTVKSQCTKKDIKKELYPCVRTEMRQACEPVETQKTSKCKKMKNVQENYPCVKKQWKQVCEQNKTPIGFCEETVMKKEMYFCDEQQSVLKGGL